MSDDPVILLRIYTRASATRDGTPYWKVLIDRARSMGLANGVALKVLDEFGGAAIVHQGKAHDLAATERVIVEIFDKPPELRAFQKTLEATDDAGLVTIESVKVIGYGGHRHSAN